jgi:AcrR family transcriptional regulator
VLERVAAEAGYSRGALYHQFAGKEDLALAVVAWVEETWWAEMAEVITDDADPAEALVGVARAHAIYCRRDIARVRMVLSVEFSGHDHPVGKAVEEAVERVLEACTGLIESGREKGTIPAGPPARVLALGLVGAVEGLVINLAGDAPFDVQLAEQIVLGLLGVPKRRGLRDRA